MSQNRRPPRPRELDSEDAQAGEGGGRLHRNTRIRGVDAVEAKRLKIHDSELLKSYERR